MSLGNDDTCEAVSTGETEIQLSNGQRRTVHNVLYVPGLKKNLLSLSNGGLHMEFERETTKCLIIIEHGNGHHTILPVQEEDDLYPIGVGVIQEIQQALLATDKTNKNTILSWHHRYGHLNNKALVNMAVKGMVNALPKLQSKLPIYAQVVCKACNIACHFKNQVQLIKQSIGAGTL